MPRQLPAQLSGRSRYVRSRNQFVPAYLVAYESGQLHDRVEQARDALQSCEVCPRRCRVNRLENRKACCHTGRYARVSAAFPHHGEEDCLRGWNGSGTIFFAWCNLRCVFCQNYETSQDGEGAEVTPSQLAGIMLRLQAAGCHNINFVTPEHVVPQILEALPLAIAGGLRLPLVYNTSSYDSQHSLRWMDSIVDIYMPDFKLWDPTRCLRYLAAKDYADVARQVIREMHRQVGELVVDEDGLALRGVLLRHLVMPGLLDDTREILRWVAGTVSPDTYVNVMDQYHPAWRANRDPKFAELRRSVRSDEMEQAFAEARAVGLWRFDRRWLDRR